MKSSLVIIALVSFVGLAVFGVFGMSHGRAHDAEPGDCLAAMSRDAICPRTGEPLESANFHVDAYRSFSLAAFPDNKINAFLLALALLLFISVMSLAFFLNHFFLRLKLGFRRYRFRPHFVPAQLYRFTRWLALHENSPGSRHGAPA